MSKWKTMKTAPKDGTDFLTWLPFGRDGYFKIGRWSEYAKCWISHGGGYSPAYWMPLPAPPTKKGPTDDR